MAIVAIFILLSVAQAVLGSPIGIDAFYYFNNGLSSIVVSHFSPLLRAIPLTFWLRSVQKALKSTQTASVHSVDPLTPPESLFEARSASKDSNMTTTPSAPISRTTLALAVVIPLVALLAALAAWVAYKTILVRRRSPPFMTPTPVSPMPLIMNTRAVPVIDVSAKSEDERMKSVRGFWSPVSPGSPDLRVEYKNLSVAVGTTLGPPTTHLPLVGRDASGFFYNSDHPRATPSTGITKYTLSPPSSDHDPSSAASGAEPTDAAVHHELISTIPVVDEGGACTRPSTPESVRTICTLTSVSSSLSLQSLETPKGHRRPVLATANQVPVIKIVEATPERFEKERQGFVQRFNSRAISPRQARLQNLI